LAVPLRTEYDPRFSIAMSAAAWPILVIAALGCCVLTWLAAKTLASLEPIRVWPILLLSLPAMAVSWVVIAVLAYSVDATTAQFGVSLAVVVYGQGYVIARTGRKAADRKFKGLRE